MIALAVVWIGTVDRSSDDNEEHFNVENTYKTPEIV